jgi:hypothetical protein
VTKIRGRGAGKTDEKRFYLPGIVVDSTCPRCSTALEHDLGEHYLSYPVMGEPFDLHLCCRDEKCWHNWSVRVRLDVALILEGP